MSLSGHKSGGFTIVELLVVLAILGVLAAAVMPLGEGLIVARKERELRQALWEIRGAIDDYRRTALKVGLSDPNAPNCPPSLQALVEGIPDPRPGARAGRIYFLRSIPRDPFADPKLPAAETWRLRSYMSPPANPHPGADVYDVKSTATGVALDGSRYDTW